MADLCTYEEISDIPSAVGHVPSNCHLLERQGNQIKNGANSDALRNSSLQAGHLQHWSSMDDIFGHLLALTYYISNRLFRFIKDLVYKDIDRCSVVMEVNYSGQPPRSPSDGILVSVFDGCLSSAGPSGAGTSTGNQESDGSGCNQDVSVNTSEIVDTHYRRWGVHYIFQGLMLPLFGLRHAWRLALTSWRFSFGYVKYAQVDVHSIIYRLQRTVHGSADDIGWLKHTPGMDPVVDGTARFLELLNGIRNGEHSLPDSYVYLLIPGLFSNHGPLYFVNTKRFFSKMGLACHIAKIHSEASVERNAWELKHYIEEIFWGSGKCVMLLGHSKGGVDAAAALSIYWSDLKDKVAGLALVQSPYGGTPLASDILREGQIGDWESRMLMKFFICNLIKGDLQALEDLTYIKRKEFLMKHKLPKEVPIISFHSEASVAPDVVATMYHIAHAELPSLPIPRFISEEENDNSVQTSRKVPVVIPISAAMAVCALHMKVRYREKSDGLVACCDAEVPGSVVVRPDQKIDHAWMVYSSWKNDPNESDASKMCEALLTMLVELGKKKKEERRRAWDQIIQY